MNRRLFTPRKSPAQKFVTGLVATAALVLAFTAGAVLWDWFSADNNVQSAPASQAAIPPAAAPASEPIILARADDAGAPQDNTQPTTQPAPPALPDTQSKPTPMDKPLAAAPDGTPSFFFCFEGNLSESRLIVVDKSRQRLMVLRYMGEMVLEYEFPCATGQKEGGKQLEGDARTPVGIYFTTHRYIDNKISMFGDRAIHLDYPNAFDLDQSRDGNGIFLHGTNQSLKPRTSNGCINMRNEDIALVGELIKEQVTPVIIVENLSLPELNQRIKACEWINQLNPDKLAAQPARMGQGLGLLQPPAGFHYSGQPALDAIGQKLWGFTHGPKAAKIKTTGVAIYGLGNQWVLVANQSMRVNNNDYNITRRFYLEGSDPREAALLRTSWVVRDQAQARALAALAPAVPEILLASANDKPVQSSQPPAPESTPVAAPTAAGSDGAAPAVRVVLTPEEQIRVMFKDWLNVWGNKNLNAYMAFYAPSFKSDKNQDYNAWRAHKQNLFRVYRQITVKASDVKITVQGKNAQVVFKQNYRSDSHRDVGIKTLKLAQQSDGRWLIVSESWKAQ